MATATWAHPGVVLEGERARLEPLRPEHEHDLREAAADPEVWRWLGEYPGDERRFNAWMFAALDRSADGCEVAFATIDRAHGRAVGSSRLLAMSEQDRRLEIGWTWLGSAAWRTGLNVEAKLLMLEHAFGPLECVRVEFKTDARNARSRAALEALPAQFEGIFRKHRIVPGVGQRDSAYYSLLDDEWPAVRANLERRLTRGAPDA